MDEFNQQIKKLRLGESILPLIMSYVLIVLYFLNDLRVYSLSKLIIYVIILIVGGYFIFSCKTKHYKKSILFLVLTFIIGWLVQQYMAMKVLEQFQEYSFISLLQTLHSNHMMEYGENAPGLIERIFSLEFTYFYILMILLGVCSSYFMPRYHKLVLKMKNLIAYGILGIIVSILSFSYTYYELIVSNAFIVIAVFYLITALYDQEFTTNRFLQCLLFEIIIFIIYIFFPENFTTLLNQLNNIFSLSWLFLLGILVIATLLLVNQDEQDNKYIGVGMYATVLYLIFIAFTKRTFDFLHVVILHLLAIFIFHIVHQGRKYSLFNLALSYVLSFVFVAVITLRLIPAWFLIVPVFILAVLTQFGLHYFNGKVYTLLLTGSLQWIFAEVVLYSLGKLHGSLISLIMMTILLWLVFGVALSWTSINDRLYFVSFNEKLSQNIMSILSLVPYFAIMVALFTTTQFIQIENQTVETKVNGKAVTSDVLKVSEYQQETENGQGRMICNYSYQWDFGKVVKLEKEEGVKSFVVPIEGKVLKVYIKDSQNQESIRYYYQK